MTVPPRSIGGRRLRLEVVTPLDPFLEDVAHIEERLEQAVATVMHRMQGRAQSRHRSS